MALSVRKKIWFGTSFLFSLLMITGGVSIYQIIRLQEQSKTILKDNYETLAFCHNMQSQLDSIKINRQAAISKFDQQLMQQEKNVTEPGESEATHSVRIDFDKLQRGDTSSFTLLRIKNQLQRILSLNMQAIEKKNIRANKTSESTLTIIVGMVGIVLVASFTFLVNFPSIITNPIRSLIEAIQEISNKNYRHRIRINNKDEFGNLADSFNQMAERLEYFESSNLNKIMFEKTRAEAVINSLKDASIGIDKNNRVLFANYQALQLLGAKSTDIVDKSIDQISKKNDLFSYLVNNETSAPFKIVVDGRENYFVKEQIEVEQGESKNRVIVLKNITSFKELDVAKTNFIATISHELKTPLASSDFSLKLLEDPRTGNLSSEQKDLITDLKQDNQRMLKILSELLNMSQVEAGRMQLKIEYVSPYTIIENAVQTVVVSAKEKNIIIEKRLDDNLPMIKADAEKTTWVINNFLTNAIKYSPNGSKIKVTVEQKDSSMTFSVSDNGPGIAKEYLPKLFEKYFQVPGSKVKGNGLGLAISKDFIEAEGGKIWVESEVGNGAIFYFSLKV